MPSSPYINRFLQPDTIIPDPTNPQSWNRYSYVLNNALKFSDPTGKCSKDVSGHIVSFSDTSVQCGGKAYTMIDHWKKKIKDKFGITMSDEGEKKWSATNLSLMYSSLENIDNALNGKLNSLVGGTTFWLNKQNAADGQYHGSTHLDGSGIIFYTLGEDALRQINIYHEVGHLFDNVPGLKNVFTNAVSKENNPSWVSNGYVSGNALVSSRINNDPYYRSIPPDATQAYNPGPSEEWADAFANYVAGNIDLSKPTGPGVDMYNFVSKTLAPYINTP